MHLDLKVNTLLLHQIDKQVDDLMKMVYQMCLEQRDILNRLQEIQRGMASLMQHCGIKIHVPLCSSSNSIWIEDDEMDI